MDYSELDRLKFKLDSYRGLQGEKVARAFEVEYTYESNKIEGNTLTLQETALVLEKGITIGNKSLVEHLEVINHAEAIDFIKDLAKRNTEITERDILQIHAIVLSGIDKKNAGKYRDVQVLISGARHIPPNPMKVHDEMENMMNWYRENPEILHPVELAGEMHKRLVSIHPFTDGNGRTSRLLMNLILIQNGFPIAILKGNTENRLQYYNALEIAQVENDKSDFKQLIFNTVKESLERILKILENH